MSVQGQPQPSIGAQISIGTKAGYVAVEHCSKSVYLEGRKTRTGGEQSSGADVQRKEHGVQQIEQTLSLHCSCCILLRNSPEALSSCVM